MGTEAVASSVGSSAEVIGPLMASMNATENKRCFMATRFAESGEGAQAFSLSDGVWMWQAGSLLDLFEQSRISGIGDGDRIVGLHDRSVGQLVRLCATVGKNVFDVSA